MAIDCVFAVYANIFSYGSIYVVCHIIPWILCWHAFEHMNNFFHPISSLSHSSNVFYNEFFCVCFLQTKLLFCLPFEWSWWWFGLAVVSEKKNCEMKIFVLCIDYFNESNWNWMNDGIDDDTAWTHIKMRNGYCLPHLFFNFSTSRKFSWA